MDFTIVFKLGLILVLAGIIGWNREQKGRPAGLRTHILVGIGAALVMIVSIRIFESYPNSDADPGRIAAQVVSGIGFLGAGTIITHGYSVKGLTTAASLWTTAALGLAVGSGFYQLSIIATTIVFISLYFFSDIKYGIHKFTTQKISIKGDADVIKPGVITDMLKNEKVSIEKMDIKKNEEQNEVTITYQIKGNSDAIDKGVEKLTDLKEIREISWKR
jgi:putative Mg2+ transporter-C (MgtC) family protein